MADLFQADRERQTIKTLAEPDLASGGPEDSALAPLLEVVRLLPRRVHPLVAPPKVGRTRRVKLRACLERLHGEPPRSAAGWQVCGEAWRVLHEYETAMAAYQRALLLDPAQVNSLHDLWWLQCWEQRFREAEALARHLCALLPQEAEPRVLLGRTLDELERPGDAVAEYRAALALSPLSWHAHLGLAWTLHRQDHQIEALGHAASAARLRPKVACAHFVHALVLEALERRDDALQALDRCLELEPRHAEALRRRAALLQSMGRSLEALRTLDRGHWEDEAAAEILSMRARLHAELGDFGAAVAALDQALLAAGDQVDLLWQKGVMLLAANRLAEAARSFRRAIRLDPAHPASHFHLGEVLLRWGRYAAATRAFRRAAQFQPDFSTAMYRAAVSCALAWDYESALGWLQRACRENPALRGVAARDQDFAGLRAHPLYAPRFAFEVENSAGG